jgi:deoxyxylulose-5-phosphate synthase
MKQEIAVTQPVIQPVIQPTTTPKPRAQAPAITKLAAENEDLKRDLSAKSERIIALEAAEELEKIGISAEVIDLRTIRPLDRETIVNSVKKTSRCITVEEGFPFASIGSEIASILMEEAFDYIKTNGIDLAFDYPYKSGTTGRVYSYLIICLWKNYF